MCRRRIPTTRVDSGKIMVDSRDWIDSNALELVRVGQVGKDESGSDGKCSKTSTGSKGGCRLLFTALGRNFHLWLNGPDVGLSVLVHRNTSLDTAGIRVLFFRENNRSWNKGLGGGDCYDTGKK